jgi:hypothetical protein
MVSGIAVMGYKGNPNVLCVATVKDALKDDDGIRGGYSFKIINYNMSLCI